MTPATHRKTLLAAGWPAWLADLAVSLHHCNTDAANQAGARLAFSADLTRLLKTPRDLDRARDLFLLRRLVESDCSAVTLLQSDKQDADWWRECVEAVLDVAELLRQRLSGQEVATMVRAAAIRAETICDTAARSGAYAASDVVRAAMLAAKKPDLTCSVSDFVAGAANAYFPGAGSAAALAVARADLLHALDQSPAVVPEDRA